MPALVGGLDLAGLSAVLKEWYIGPVNEQLNQEVMVTQLLNITDENLEGLKAVVPLHSSRSGGIGSRAERAQLPNAGQQGYNRAEYQLKYHYARVEVTGQSIQRTNSDRGAFLQAFKSELSYIRKDVQSDMARQFYGDGSATICIVLDAAGVNSATQTPQDKEAIFKGFIYVGMVVDILKTSDNSVVASAKTVTDVDLTAGTFTLDAAVDLTPTPTDFRVVRSGNRTGAVVDEIDSGLQAIIGTGTLGGINPATAGKKFWQGIVDASFGATLELDDLMQMYNRVNNAGSRADQTIVMMTPGLLRRLFGTSFSTPIQFVNTTTLRGGFEKLSFAAGAGPMTLYADRLHPWGQVSFVDKDGIQAYSPADWAFLDRDGLTIRWVPDYDAFQALLFRYINLGASRRNTSMRLTGFTDLGV